MSHIMTCLSTASSQKLIHEGFCRPPKFCSPYPDPQSKKRCFVFDWRAHLRPIKKVKEGAVSRSQLLTGPGAFWDFLLCLRASEPTTPELASTEGVRHIRGWAWIFRLGGRENRRKNIRKVAWILVRETAQLWCRFWSPFFPVPKNPRQHSNPPLDNNPCQILKFVVGDISKCPTLVLCRKVWQAIHLSIRYNNSNTRFMTPRPLELLNHGMTVMHTCNDATHMALSKAGEINISVLGNSRHNPERNTSMNRILLGKTKSAKFPLCLRNPEHSPLSNVLYYVVALHQSTFPNRCHVILRLVTFSLSEDLLRERDGLHRSNF